MYAYQHTIQTHKNDTWWCSFIDVDEFLYSLGELQLTIASYDKSGISAIAVHWLLFGSSGHLTYSPEPVTKRFTRRAAEVNPHVKSIVRLCDAVVPLDPHSFGVKNTVVDEYCNVLITNEAKDFCKNYSLQYSGTADILCINHYVTKSKEECERRRCGGVRADTGVPHGENFFEAHDRNDVEDKDIWKVL